MVKTGQIKRCQGLENLERHAVAVCNSHHVVFNQLRYISKINSYVSQGDLDKEALTFCYPSVLRTMQWVKPVWPAKLIFLTSTALMGVRLVSPQSPHYERRG